VSTSRRFEGYDPDAAEALRMHRDYLANKAEVEQLREDAALARELKRKNDELERRIHELDAESDRRVRELKQRAALPLAVLASMESKDTQQVLLEFQKLLSAEGLSMGKLQILSGQGSQGQQALERSLSTALGGVVATLKALPPDPSRAPLVAVLERLLGDVG
jgi:aminopeptidase N